MSKKIRLDKEKYREVCASRPDIPIFLQAWWLDATCTEGTWDVMLYIEDPHVVAVMPWYEKRNLLFKYITMPPLTKFAGPYFLKSFSERKQQSILTKMVAEIPKKNSHQQTLHYQMKNWLPYKWQGFSQTAYYSYQLSNISDLKKVYSSISADYRNHKFKRCETILKIRQDLPTSELLRICRQPFIRQGSKLPFKEEIIASLVERIQTEGQGTSIYSVDQEGGIQAAVYLVWDALATYVLFTGEYEKYRSVGSGLYTLWKSIEYAHDHCPGKIFDFLGGMSEGVERTRRQFGAEQITYFYIWRQNFLFKLLQTLSRGEFVKRN